MFRKLKSYRNSGLWALVVLIAIVLLNHYLSRDLSVGQMTPDERALPVSMLNDGVEVVYGLLIIAIAACWLADRRQPMYQVIYVLNLICTAALFVTTLLLVRRLAESVPVTATALIRDGALIFGANILIFALWYWIIDSNQVRMFRGAPEDTRWDFMFPQRQEAIPGYEDWKPQFVDYLFIAFTTSVAFSPTDTAPLSRIAKALMVTESVIALIVLSVIAGTAINMLSG